MKPSLIHIILCAFALSSCHKHKDIPVFSGTQPYATNGPYIYHYKYPVQLIGADAFHVFSAGGTDMTSWHLDIAREFIGNMEQEPLSGSVLKDNNGSYLYPLQTIVDSNRANGRITILCPFGWDGSSSTVFSGTMPAKTSWWSAYQAKMAQWAIQFSNQPDVWIEVWNEPYNYNRTDGYTDEVWLDDMTGMVNIIRNAGNNNIILVPGAEQGQDESVLENKGPSFLQGRTNILFDIHAYEKWLLVPMSEMGTRLQQLKLNNIPVIFGETAPMNAGFLMDPAPFLDSIYHRGLSVCAWVWKNDSTDTDALLTLSGLPNNYNNNQWGSSFKSLAALPRVP